MATLEHLLIGLRDPESIDVSGGDVTPTNEVRGITVNGSGNVAIEFSNSVTATVYLEPGIQYFFAGVKTIKQTGTTATGIYVWR